MDLSAVIGAVDLTTVTAGVLTIAGLIAVVKVAIMASRKLLSFIR